MAYKIIVGFDAKNDIDKTVEYYENQSQNLGIDFYLEFISITDVIENFPERFPPKFTPCQRAQMKKFPYNIFFLVDDGNKTIKILGVFHNRRNPESIEKRLKS